MQIENEFKLNNEKENMQNDSEKKVSDLFQSSDSDFGFLTPNEDILAKIVNTKCQENIKMT